MPVTPFHFGPGAALHAIAPRHVSLIAFCAANVIIDIESGYNLLRGADHVHTFLHSYVGATLMLLGVLVIHAALCRAAVRAPLPNLFQWRALTRAQVAWGAALGAYSHIVLDSIMHADMQPLAPFSTGNTLLRLVSLDVLHFGCVVFGVFGVATLVARMVARRRSAA